MINTHFSSSLSQKIRSKAVKPLTWLFVAIFTLSPFGFLPASAEFSSMLAPTAYTPSSYIPPRYDSFDHDYYRPPSVSGTGDQPDTPPVADFRISNDQLGLQSGDRGTTTTRFTFDANDSTDNETDSAKLEARWDFENDGVPDSYFSQTKIIQHTFDKAGMYTVKLEILDTAGNISSTTKTVTVADSTPPSAFFVMTPQTGTEKAVFHFDTSGSRDDQYIASSLQYRFDWDGDGRWDTTYQDKTDWYHRFNKSGTFNVVMEVKDPQGATAQASQTVTTFGNTPPIANLTIKSMPSQQGAGYEFDSSASSDAETAHQNLLYRWDTNYNGPNDIVYNTDWSYSPTYSGYYGVPGTKVIKLEVKDEDGAVSTSYAQITVPWTDSMAKNGGGLK